MIAKVFAVAFAATLAATTLGGAPVPYRPDGHFLHPHLTGQIVLEAFYDFACPDCKQSYPIVKQVLQHYGPAKVGSALFRLLLLFFPALDSQSCSA